MPSTFSSSTNQSLIERVLHRDPFAWSQFVELYGPLIQYWCRRTWQAFERTVMDGLSTEAAGQELNLPSATVRQYRSRVLRRIRQQLGEHK